MYIQDGTERRNGAYDGSPRSRGHQRSRCVVEFFYSRTLLFFILVLVRVVSGALIYQDNVVGQHQLVAIHFKKNLRHHHHILLAVDSNLL